MDHELVIALFRTDDQALADSTRDTVLAQKWIKTSDTACTYAYTYLTEFANHGSLQQIRAVSAGLAQALAILDK